MDKVDIGGAAAAGRPRVPPMQTIVFEENSGPRLVVNGQEVSPANGSGAVDAVTVAPVDIPERVRFAAGPGVSGVAYPDDHPANLPDFELDEGSGAIILKPGQRVPTATVLGDVRTGYVTGQAGDRAVTRGNRSQQPPAQPQTPAQAAEDLLNQLALEEEEMSAPRPTPHAVDTVGDPLIEVVYSTPWGKMVAYYHKVVRTEDNRWLILVVDNRAASRERFIPTPVVTQGQDGVDRYATIPIIVTGKDKREERMEVTPLNMLFTVDSYDFMVLAVSPGAPKEA